MTVTPTVSIVIVSYNTSAILRECLLSIVRETRIPHEIVVVDNASSDDSCGMVEREFPNVHLVKNVGNVGFARANNRGLAVASGEYILYLNPDTVILENAIERMVTCLQQRPQTGLLGPHVYNADGKTHQASVFRFPTVKRLFHVHVPIFRLPPLGWLVKPEHNYPYVPKISGSVEGVSGCCMLMPTDLSRDIGGMNEEYFMYSEEFDLCAAVVERGREVYYFREASIIHLGGASTSAVSETMSVELLRSMMRYFQRVNPSALPSVRLLYVIGSSWRWAMWVIVGALGMKTGEAEMKQRNHAAMLRWLWKDFDF